ncbi:unnamed protein product [Arabidopsis lyrata]
MGAKKSLEELREERLKRKRVEKERQRARETVVFTGGEFWDYIGGSGFTLHYEIILNLHFV